jgi:hypothetical protein
MGETSGCVASDEEVWVQHGQPKTVQGQRPTTKRACT